jgi:hypothetical protein
MQLLYIVTVLNTLLTATDDIFPTTSLVGGFDDKNMESNSKFGSEGRKTILIK